MPARRSPHRSCPAPHWLCWCSSRSCSTFPCYFGATGEPECAERRWRGDLRGHDRRVAETDPIVKFDEAPRLPYSRPPPYTRCSYDLRQPTIAERRHVPTDASG